MDTGSIRSRMQKSIDALIRDLARIRTGIASPSMLDSVVVDYFGTPTPVSHMANISIPEPRTMAIKPFDKSMLEAIDKAILASGLGLTPQNDGQIIRLTLPILTSERRQELAKKVRAVGEEGKVGIRNIRRDENENLKKEAKENSQSEDEVKHLRDEIQHLTDEYIAKVDKLVQEKEHDILSV